MNYIVNRIDLDVHDAGAQAWINVRQNETNRKICIALTESGEPFALTEDCDAVFAGTKPDATVFFNSCEITGNTIEYVLTGQNLAQTGDLKCEIRLYGSGNTLICSPRFVVHVQENAVDDNGIESSDEFSELTELIGDARAATDAANASVITDATASVDSNVGTPRVELTLTQEENGQSMDFEFHNLKGETGDPGVHVGDTAPTNPAISLWIDTDDNGASQVLSVMGTFASLAALQAAVTNPNNGDSYGVGTAAPYDIYRYDESSGEWINYGNYKGNIGPVGPQGPAGADGFSPTATVTKSGSVATITITDKNGTTTANVYDGSGGGGNVNSVNGQTGDVELTASDVGALPDSTVIDDVYWCTYGTTTSAQIESALTAGKIPMVKYQDYVYTLRYRNSATNHRFVCNYGGKEKSVACQSGTWMPNGDLTFLTAYTETDPVFSASAAAGISSSDITNWNAKPSVDQINSKAPIITDTATGAIANFPDGADDIPVVDLVVDIEPKQSGSGDPSPDNIRPITGWTGLTLNRTGTNLVNQDVLLLGTSWVKSPGSLPTFAGQPVYYGTLSNLCGTGETLHNAIPVTFEYEENTRYRVCYWWKRETPSTANGLKIQFYYTDGTSSSSSHQSNNTSDFIRQGMASSAGKTISRISLTYNSSSAVYIAGFAIEKYDGTERDTTAVIGNEIQTIPIDWTSEAGTVYGGSLDVTTGVLTVTDGYIASYDGETLPSTWISDRDVYAPDTTPTTGAEVVYKLDTPQTYQLTGQQINTLKGRNNIWANTGDTTVEYCADTELYLEKDQLRQDENLAYVETSSTASRAYSVGDFFVNEDGILCEITASVLSGGALIESTNYTVIGGNGGLGSAVVSKSSFAFDSATQTLTITVT